MVQKLSNHKESHKHLNFHDKFDIEDQGQVTSFKLIQNLRRQKIVQV